MNMELSVLIIVFVAVAAFVLVLASAARMYKKVGPNQALIVYGLGGTRVVTGSGALVMPMVQTSRELSLELMSFDVAPAKELYTHQGVAVLIDAVSQLKVKNELVSVKTAAEQFLDKSPQQREAAIRLVMEGHLRGIVGQLTVEDIVKDPEMVGDKVRLTCAADLSKMGLEMVSFTIKEVRDQNQYIEHMGRPDIERIKKEANIAAAEAQRDTDIKRAEAVRDAAVAKAGADQSRVTAEAASRSKQAEAERDFEVKKAQYVELVQRQKAVADKSYEIQQSVMQQQLVAEQVKVQQVERAAQVELEATEISRKENELTAAYFTTAQVEAKRVLELAQAEKARLSLEAEGRAEAIRQEGMAEAEVIRMKGEAEAAAMDVKAKAYRGYTEAALVDRLITSLPEVVAAVAAPLSKIDKITLISTGGDREGGGMGIDRITGDVVKVVAQVPALLESLSGVNVSELVKSLPRAAIGANASGSTIGNGAAKVVAPRPAPPAAPAR